MLSYLYRLYCVSLSQSVFTSTHLLVTHLCQYGVYSRFLGSTNTIPQRETVAGEAYCKSPTCDGEDSWCKEKWELGKISCWQQYCTSNKPQTAGHSDPVNESVLHWLEWGACCHPWLSSYFQPTEHPHPHQTGCTCENKCMSSYINKWIPADPTSCTTDGVMHPFIYSFIYLGLYSRSVKAAIRSPQATQLTSLNMSVRNI